MSFTSVFMQFFSFELFIVVPLVFFASKCNFSMHLLIEKKMVPRPLGFAVYFIKKKRHVGYLEKICKEAEKIGDPTVGNHYLMTA